ncbi:MAG: S46 family peptidase [Verrucomicrobiota bacterium]|nr:S46 family peptidase [Verrucomicrobiota bacterium]
MAMIITNRSHSKSGLTALFLTLAAATSLADEGMWLFNQPPRKLLREKYNFEPSTAWLEHLQQASVRFNSGGSGSFVSEDGLVMSNHHVGADALQKLSDKDHNYLRDGFFARTLAEEKRCHDLELNVLVSIEDVTDRVNAAVKPDMTPEQAFLARRKVIAEIEKESLDRTGLRSDVVTLYQGGQYHLYRFKRYTDVRLVFAPEQQIAFFGGDPDNFEYPRYDLDICFFRVYENGKPARIPHWLKWSRAGAAENELIFVSGHPGHTARLLTLAEIEYQRDVSFPETLAWLHRREVLLTAYGERSEENARRARDDLFGIQNSRKAREGGLAGLLDPAFIARKQADEQALKNAVAQNPKYASAKDAWDRIAAAQRVIAENAALHRLLESARGFNCELFGIARTLLRAADERPKPDGERLSEFHESGRASLELNLFSTKPIYDDYEQLCLADSLTFLAERLGAKHPIVERVLAGKSPRQRAAELVRDTKVKDVAFRRKLYEGGKAAVDAARDPMIELARAVDAEARAVRQIIETQEEIKRQAHSQIAAARFAIQGTSTYPDATFTLRLAFGIVKGYEENGKHVPYQTTFAGLYQRSKEQGGRPPFDLPERWMKARRRLDLKTPLNFVSTADIIGGNSGSPVVNKNGELVGIIFDGNIQSLVLDFYYTEEQARALAVHSSAITHALRRVYGANRLADELEGRRRR